MGMVPIDRIEAMEESDPTWLRAAVARHFGGEPIVTISGRYWLEGIAGLKAVRSGEPKGFLHYRITSAACEIVTLVSLESGRGIGGALVDAVHDQCRRAGCTRLWLTTTNDNLTALRFYQKRDFRIIAVHRGAMAKVRAIKPDVPLAGKDGVPLYDLIELERDLTGDDRELDG